MFNSDKDKIKELETQIRDIKHTNRLEIDSIKKEHELALKEKDFEIKHLADEKVKALESEVVEKSKKIAVLEQKVEMLDKIVDLNADVIDVKELVTNLISKLPEIKLTSLPGSTPSKN